jgi:hypothetical protein
MKKFKIKKKKEGEKTSLEYCFGLIEASDTDAPN